jgi:hypothetical protein
VGEGDHNVAEIRHAICNTARYVPGVASEDVSCVMATAAALFGCLGKKHVEATMHDYYAMDITKPQYVDVKVYPKGTLTPLNKVELPFQFPSL